MSRELKFRVWWKDKSLGYSIYTEYGLFDDTWTDKEYIAIEQYTGLKDKNGKEIYEGDILKSDDRNDLKYYPTLVAVKWSDIYLGFTPFADYDRDCNIWYVEEYCEVIGNIHENPELLEQEDAKD